MTPPSTRVDELFLVDILDAISSIRRFLVGTDESRFLTNELVRCAVLYHLAVIGEASQRLSADVTGRHPGVLWQELRTYRNFCVPVYFAITWDQTWKICHEALPALEKQVREVLRVEFPELFAQLSPGGQ